MVRRVTGEYLLYITDGSAFAETLELGLGIDMVPPSVIKPSIANDTLLELEPVMQIPVGLDQLFIAPHTASWVILDGFESRLARELDRRSFRSLRGAFPDVDANLLLEFLIQLYQRGLLRINSQPGLEPKFVRDGAVFREANLVEILITQKCNLACLYCLAEAGPDMPHMHPEIAFRAVDEAFQLRDDVPLAIQLSGGEPFVNFRLFQQLVGYIEGKQKSTGRKALVATQSNGTLIDDRVAAFVKDHNISIGISMDGPSHLDNHSRPMLGGGPSHERMMRGVKTLQRHGVKFGTILVLSRANVGHPEEVADFFVENGIRSVKINPISMIGDAQSTWDRMAVTTDEYFEFLDRFMCYVVSNRLPLRESNLAEYLKYLFRRMHNYRCMRSNCGAGRSFFLIDAKGDVYPCAHSAGISEWRIGHIDEACGDLVQLGSRNPVVAKFHGRLVDRMAATRNCPWRHFCEAGCAVNAHQRFGTMLAPDTLCSFYERIYPRLLELLDSAPAQFQILLDLMLGKDQAFVTAFSALGQQLQVNAATGFVPQAKEVTPTRYH